MFKLKLLIIPIVFIAVISCNTENGVDDIEKLDNYTIEGSAQKGPFINGSNIVVYELNENFIQTGKSFNTTTGISGDFTLKNIPLSAPYIEIVADGFYFNEISGDLSKERLSLKAIADISSGETINVNVLTHLEYERVKYLIANESLSISGAKEKARNEVLKLFSLDSYDFDNAERLNIFGSTNGDAILLTISSIMQGNHTTAELSKLLADIVIDMKEDGELNDALIGSTLKGQALTLNCEKIEENLLKQTVELGLEVDEITAFKQYVDYFIENSDFTFTSPFSFPESTENGINVLGNKLVDFNINTEYSFAAEMPGAGGLVVKMKKTSGGGLWWYQPFRANGWNVTNFDNNEQTFTSTLHKTTIDLPIGFSGNGVALIEYYYNGASSPSAVKTISWGVENNSEYVFVENSPMGENLLSFNDSSIISNDTTYIVGLQKEGAWEANFLLYFDSDISVEVIDGFGEFEYSGLENPISFTLSNTDDIPGNSEIVFKFNGMGHFTISSSDLYLGGGDFNRHLRVE